MGDDRSTMNIPALQEIVNKFKDLSEKLGAAIKALALAIAALRAAAWISGFSTAVYAQWLSTIKGYLETAKRILDTIREAIEKAISERLEADGLMKNIVGS